MTINGAKLPINGTTATLTVPNDLKDGTYVNLTVTFVSALAGGADEASAVALTDNTVTNFAGGWYKVDSNITFDHTLNLLADTYLTIAEGKTMTVNTASGKAIDSEYTLNVSGEGALNITTTEAYKIAVRVGSYVQTGATVTANGYIGIRCRDNFDEFNVTNDFTFSGGQLTATGSGGDGIWADNDITLSCTNATDFIQTSSYSSAYGAVKIADGKTLVDENGTIWSGALYSNQIQDINGRTLRPFKTITLADNADNSSTISEWNGGVAEVTLSGRTLYKDGDWNTLCLPFAISDFTGTPLAGATVKELLTTSNLDNGTLTLNFSDDLTAIEAGKPYIVKWASGENIVSPVFEGVTVSNADTEVSFSGGSFIGNYSPFAITDENKSTILLLSSGNKLGYSKKARTLGSCRAYFYTPGDTPARSFILDFGDGETTGINSMSDVRSQKSDGWYDLQGRKVESTAQKGVYVKNGKKVVIK